MAAAVAAGGPVDLEHVEAFVDGAAVRRVGSLTHQVVDRFRPRLATVPEGQVCVEMLELYQVDGIIAEPAGALAPAALAELDLPAGATVVCVLSGGNNDVSRYAEVVERALVHTGRKHYFLVEFPQEPGALRQFLDDVLGPDDDITLFEYVKRNNRETGPALVGIELGVCRRPRSRCWPGWPPRRPASSGSPRTAPCSAFSSDAELTPVSKRSAGNWRQLGASQGTRKPSATSSLTWVTRSAATTPTESPIKSATASRIWAVVRSPSLAPTSAASTVSTRRARRIPRC